MRKMQRKVEIRIDMTPMVDVIILLLIFFFMASSFREPEAVDVSLPNAYAGTKLPKSGIFSVLIDSEGNIYHLLEPIKGRKELVDAIVQARAENPNTRFAIKADYETDYGTVLAVMKDFKSVGVTVFLLTIKKESGAW
jgi:biopolymer transport protein ExbD